MNEDIIWDEPEDDIVWDEPKARAPKATPKPSSPKRMPGVVTASSTTEGRRKPRTASKLTGITDDQMRPEGYLSHLASGGRDFVQAAGHNAMGFLHGTANLVGEGAAQATEAAGRAAPMSFGGLAQVMRRTADSDQAATRAWEQQYQQDVPDSPAAFAGAATGQVLPWTVGAPAKLLTGISGRLASALPNTPVTGRVLSGAAQGATVGASLPVTGDGAYLPQKAEQVSTSAAVGGALPWLVAGAQGIGNLARPAIAPGDIAAQNLARHLGADTSTVTKLRSAPEYVTGERPTMAQVLQTPEAVMAEKALMNRPEYRAAFERQATENNALRVGVLRDLAGTDEALTAAIQNRRANAAAFRDPNLPEEGSKLVDPGPVITTLERLSKSANPAVRGSAREHLSLLRAQADKSGRVPAFSLDDIRQNANAMIAKHTPQGMQSSQEAAKYGAVPAQILRTLDRELPGYRNYLATYRADSAQPSTMEAARRILGPVDQRGLDSSGSNRLTLGALNAGLNRADKQRYGLSPDAREKLEGVRKSLQRESISGSVRSPGSDTAFNINADGWLARQALGENLSGPSGAVRAIAAPIGAGVGSMMGGAAGAAVGAGLGLTLKRGADVVNKRIMDRYAEGVLNPKEAATMIESFLSKNAATPKARQQLLSAYPRWAAILESNRAK